MALYREKLQLDTTQRDNLFTVGNTGFWATQKNNGYDRRPAWILNFTPENNRDQNIDPSRKELYQNLALLGIWQLWQQIKADGSGSILVVPSTNYRFYRYLHNLVMRHAPKAEINHIVAPSTLQDIRYKKHTYVIDLSVLCQAPSFKTDAKQARTYLENLVGKSFELVFEIDD